MDVLRYPKYRELWKAALVDPRIAGLGYGDTISHKDMREAVGLPDPATLDTFKDIQTAQLAYVHSVEHIRRVFLEDKCMDLQNDRGVGYVVVMPDEQTKRASEDCENALKKTLRKTVKRLSFIDYTQLTSEQRKENADALARLSFFRKAIKTENTKPKEIEA